MRYVVRKHEYKKLHAAIDCHQRNRPFLANDKLHMITSYQVREDSLVLELKEIEFGD